MSNNEPAYHTPVLLHAAVDGLQISENGVYVDVTFGGGGHSREILKRLKSSGRLVAFDQDSNAAKNAEKINYPNFTLIADNFRCLQHRLNDKGIYQVQGILADLGVSSHQFDDAARGFSLRYEGPLDMRMNRSQKISARDIVNTYTEEELARIFYYYGEVENSRRLAKAITLYRKNNQITTTTQLAELIQKHTNTKKTKQYIAQVFQAIRIEVNDELGALKELLMQSDKLLCTGGRLVVISYHSLEDRLVKNYMRSGNFEGTIEKNFFGHQLKPFKEITKKPITPAATEIEQNPRARSAKLRIAEKIEKHI
jgi:16S rRNA (cytosine1402-N4)-methyltransferase